ncbi:hypothetical protein [Tenacibaculum sp. nBUS_03]
MVSKARHRLTMKVDENAGQLVCALHLHLIGGDNLGTVIKK